jgi:hypothetical protein
MEAAMQCRYLPFVWLLTLGPLVAIAQQAADMDFVPRVSSATFREGEGPRVAIDEAHFNFHTADGRYAPFTALLRRDGFIVTPLRERLSQDVLANVDVLVIANALNEMNVERWALPTPSAFAADEIAAVRGWVEKGGALLLIADHMPFGGAAADLGRAFGLKFSNGYATAPAAANGWFVFNRASGGLRDHPIVRGRNDGESVAKVTTFMGQAFTVAGGRELFVLPEAAVVALPEAAGQITAGTPSEPVGGHLQGATLTVGEGRVAAFGEAAMFSAQVAGPDRLRAGMNAPGAEQNAQFVLNVLHWLAGVLPRD